MADEILEVGADDDLKSANWIKKRDDTLGGIAARVAAESGDVSPPESAQAPPPDSA